MAVGVAPAEDGRAAGIAVTARTITVGEMVIAVTTVAEAATTRIALAVNVAASIAAADGRTGTRVGATIRQSSRDSPALARDHITGLISREVRKTTLNVVNFVR